MDNLPKFAHARCPDAQLAYHLLRLHLPEPWDSAPAREAQKYGALAVAHAGFAVLPLGHQHIAPLFPSVKYATCDLAVLCKIYGRSGKANVGVATGARAGVVAITIDGRRLGDDYFWYFERVFGPVLSTSTVFLPRRQRTLLFRQPAFKINSSEEILGHGIDVHAEDGYLPMPPSCNGYWWPYEWETQGDTVPHVAPMPGWLALAAAMAGIANVTDDMQQVVVHGLALNSQYCRPKLPLKHVSFIADCVAGMLRCRVAPRGAA